MTTHSLETFVPQQKQQRNDGSHVPQDANDQDVRGGQTHPYSYGHGAAQFYHGQCGDDGEYGEIGEMEGGSKVIGDFLPRVQMLFCLGGGGEGGRRGGGEDCGGYGEGTEGRLRQCGSVIV